MDKLGFAFEVKSASDGKTNLICITSIATEDGRTFKIPEEYQVVNHHLELMKTQAYAKIKNTLKRRHQSRKIWINLSTELSMTYLDENGNLQFNDYFLEEITNEMTPPATQTSTDQSMIKLLEKLLEEKQNDSEIKNLGKLAKDFMIEKFTLKNSNALQWINEFEKECKRFKITENKKKIEILGFFLEKACKDWYSCMLLKFTVESEWEMWKKNFCETFANKGWSPIRYALSFRYQTGSLLEYAIKKETLLLEVRKSIDKGTLIEPIPSGLPNFICNKINRETVTETEDLYNEIGNLEHLINKNKWENKKNIYNTKEKIEKTPCKICKDKNKGIRYHPGNTCWFKEKEDKIKNVNNSELEVELNYKDQKNLIPPLIKLNVLLNGTLNVTGIYDSGSNVSVINSKILKIKKENTSENKKVNLRTINDETRSPFSTLRIGSSDSQDSREGRKASLYDHCN